MKKTINSTIVFSTDETYAMPTSIAIKSLLDNVSKNIKLKIIILSEKKLSKKTEDIFSKITLETNAEIRQISVGDCFSNNILRIKHISKATYYRLLLPKLLEQTEQCLYLDGDICVNGCIDELLKTQLNKDEYIAGVKAPGIQLKRRGKKKRLTILGIKSLDKYINAGVIILNLKSIRENYVYDKMINLSKKNFPVQDQDVLNVACDGHIKILEPKYNAMPHLFKYTKNRLKKIYNKEEILDAKQNPIIIHYADKYKPWIYKDISYSDIWNYYYEQIYKHRLTNLKNSKTDKIQDRIHSLIGQLYNPIKNRIFIDKERK